MAKLIYSVIASLDGYTEDATGDFGWAAPGEDVHAFVNELEGPVGTYLYGRRMYEVMTYWETAHLLPDESQIGHEFAEIWRLAEKVVYSRTLTEVSTAKTRIESAFEPEAIRRLKASAQADLGVGGPELAAQAIRAGLVDECQIFLTPITVGSGKPAFPEDIAVKLELLEERHFDDGTVYLRYQVRADAAGVASG